MSVDTIQRIADRIEKLSMPVSLADPQGDDLPLVYCNPAFEQLTLYRKSQIVNRNCRFLQGERTEPEKVQALRDSIRNRTPVTTKLTNYRADGSEFVNWLYMQPLRDLDGEVMMFMGCQLAIPDRFLQLERSSADWEAQNEHIQHARAQLHHMIESSFRNRADFVTTLIHTWMDQAAVRDRDINRL